MHRVYDSILDVVGDTPLVRLNKVTKGLAANVYAKLEYMNPAGSIKDRIAIKILDSYAREGRLKDGSVIVEATSGNTGAGLAMVSCVRNYKPIFVLADKQSEEKRQALRAWGAKVVVTPTDVEADDPRSYYSVARKTVEDTPGAVYANQYHNPVNPQTHYEWTGPEIYKQLDGKIDVLVAGLGTGGTITGIGKYLKEQNPKIQVVGIDPVGSLYYDYFHTGQMTRPFSYLVEGIGEDFLPSTMDFTYVDDVIRVNDAECFRTTRRLVREEGLFGGASSGAAVAGAVKYLQKRASEQLNVVVILPDGGRAYLSKVFNDNWMRENGFLDEEMNLGTVADLLRHIGQRELVSIAPTATLSEVIGILKVNGISQVPVVDNGRLVGMVTETRLLQRALKERGGSQRVGDLVEQDYCTISRSTELSVLSELFRNAKVAIVLEEDDRPTDIVTRIDVIDYIAAQARNRG